MRQGQLRHRAVFLDKDGTLIEDIPYNVDPQLIRLAPRADEAIPRLHEAGYQIVVVSNQSGVARGIFAEDALIGVRLRLEELLADLGVPLAGFYYCPHHPAGEVGAFAVPCNCRKPAPGMLFQAARDLDLDLETSWLIGDILDDVEAGCRAGCRTVLIDSGHETLWEWSRTRRPNIIAANLAEAAEYISLTTIPTGAMEAVPCRE